MQKRFSNQLCLGLGTLCAGIAMAAPAATIFNNSSNTLSARFDPGTTEIGDQIILAGSERMLTHFSFEFWGTNRASPGNLAFAGPVQARVRFYLNDGPLFNTYATPGTSFYDSGWFSGFGPASAATLNFSAGSDFPSDGLLIPADEITWSVQFRGLGATDTLGVDLYSPPTVGSDYPDYWVSNGGGGWALWTNVVSMNFGAVFEASVVPEPASATLVLVAAVGALAVARRRRHKEFAD